jgi:flagellar hook-associated protein 2
MAGLTVSSTLDVNSIVSQLMAVEQAPMKALQAKETKYNAQLSAYGQIKSAMDTFKTALGKLTVDALNAQTAVSSAPTSLGVTAGGTAVSGSYAITVQQLARADKQQFDGVASASTQLGSGTMSIKVGSGDAIAITTTDTSMQGIAQAINKANAGVSATIVNDGKINHLVVTGQKTGEANAVTITADGDLSIFDTSAAKAHQVAQDANFTVDGIAVTKPSNTVTDAISGVTLTLSMVSADPINVNITRDTATVKTNISDFAKAVSALNSTIKKLTAYDAATKTASPLTGDSGARTILNNVRTQMMGGVSGVTGYNTLASLGIMFNSDGSMAVDDTKLTKAITADPTALTQVFTGANGIGTKLTNVATQILGDNGVLTSRTAGLNASLKTVNDRETDMQTRLDAKQKNLYTQYSALDAKLSAMQAQSNAVTQQLAALYK